MQAGVQPTSPRQQLCPGGRRCRQPGPHLQAGEGCGKPGWQPARQTIQRQVEVGRRPCLPRHSTGAAAAPCRCATAVGAAARPAAAARLAAAGAAGACAAQLPGRGEAACQAVARQIQYCEPAAPTQGGRAGQGGLLVRLRHACSCSRCTAGHPCPRCLERKSLEAHLSRPPAQSDGSVPRRPSWERRRAARAGRRASGGPSAASSAGSSKRHVDAAAGSPRRSHALRTCS